MSHNGSSDSHAELDVMRHSAAHVLAKAVQQLYPGSRLGIGPVIENGFYYDIDIPTKLSEDDLPRIEDTMREIIVWKRGSSFSSGRSIASNTRIAIDCADADSATHLPSRQRYALRGIEYGMRDPMRGCR